MDGFIMDGDPGHDDATGIQESDRRPEQLSVAFAK